MAKQRIIPLLPGDLATITNNSQEIRADMAQIIDMLQRHFDLVEALADTVTDNQNRIRDLEKLVGIDAETAE